MDKTYNQIVIAGRGKLNHRFHEVSALRALMHAARSLRENGNMILVKISNNLLVS